MPARTKAIPPPPDDLKTVARIRHAVPLVPGSTEDCCSRIVADAGDVVPGRDDANRWLAFLEALNLVAAHDRGYARTRADLDRASIAEGLLERVYGAEEVCEILADADAPLDADTVFDRFEDAVPPWERSRDPGGWRDHWRDRVEHLLGWLVLAEQVECADGGFQPAE